jgi:hypothetical protein
MMAMKFLATVIVLDNVSNKAPHFFAKRLKINAEFAANHHQFAANHHGVRTSPLVA